MSRPRRDPRADRETHRIGQTQRPRYDLAAVAARRPRRDPRREKAGLVVAQSPRLRLDRTHGGASISQPEAAISPITTAPEIVTLEQAAFWVLVVADPSGDLTALDQQLLGAARSLAGKDGGVIFAAESDLVGVGEAGADRFVRLPVIDAKTVSALMDAFQPRHTIFPETFHGSDLARRLAARRGEALFSQIEQIGTRGAVRPVRGRRIDQEITSPSPILTIAPDMISAYGGEPREARVLPFEPAASAIADEVEILTPAAGALPLGEADFVVSAGNGINDFDAFRALASALGATPGASRVVCDAGLMPRGAQVGASGTVLSADCYFALGIAGAPQHLQGIAGCRHVLAVNIDLHAAMIERAELAIVADAHPVMEALIRLLAEEPA